MSLKLTIFACLFANFLFSYRGYEAKPTAVKPQSIVDVIASDASICNSTREISKHTKYLNECSKINYPDKFVNLTDTNLNEFLCLAIYDGFMKIGHCDDGAGKKLKEENISVLNNQTLFEREIETMFKSNGNNPWNLCANLKNLSLPIFNRTAYFVSQLESKFDTNKHCIDMCVISNDVINPLCIILEIIDQQMRLKVGDNTSVKKDIKPIPMESAKHQSTDDAKITKVGEDHPQVDSNSHTVKVDATGSHISESAIRPITDGTKISTVAKQKNQIEETEENPLDIPDISKEAIGAANSAKSTTIPEKIVDEDQGDLSPEYKAEMTDDNDLISDLEKGDSMDDIQSSITKQIQQPEVAPIDEKGNIRLPSLHKEDDSHFFGYFTIIGFIGISACLIYHHKQKILAMIVEGRRSRGGRGRKRPSTANYRKLDSNLEEAVTSQCNSNVTHVIY